MKKRKKVAEIRAAAAKAARRETIAEVCQVLKWHLGQTLTAETLYELMLSGERLNRGPYYDKPGEPWVTVPPLEMN